MEVGEAKEGRQALSEDVVVTETEKEAKGRCRRFVLVQYPGVVKNTDKALHTLGGTERISSVGVVCSFKASFFWVCTRKNDAK